MRILTHAEEHHIKSGQGPKHSGQACDVGYLIVECRKKRQELGRFRFTSEKRLPNQSLIPVLVVDWHPAFVCEEHHDTAPFDIGFSQNRE